MAAAIGRARERSVTIPAPAEGQVLTLAEAYAVQRLRTRARLDRGERVVGWKLGYTSAAMREQMGVRQPNLGPLTDAMLLPSGSVLPADVVQPRVEPEIALVLGTDVTGPLTRAQAAASVRQALAALEVVDSVWTDYRFTLEDNTADGSSAAYVVLGPPVGVDDVNALDDVPVTLVRNGRPAGSGAGRDALGHPLDALAWLAGELHRDGAGLRAGDVVITGGLTAAVPLGPGDRVEARIGAAGVDIARAAEETP